MAVTDLWKDEREILDHLAPWGDPLNDPEGFADRAAERHRWWSSLASAPRRLYQLTFSPRDSVDLPVGEFDVQEEANRDRVQVTELDEASAYSSESALAKGQHVIAIDLDLPTMLVASSTPGHYHLVIDKEMSWPQYAKVLRVLAEVGVIEEGYWQAALRRQATFLRLPWYPKRTPQ